MERREGVARTDFYRCWHADFASGDCGSTGTLGSSKNGEPPLCLVVT